ncbi:MAG: A24 family peptidase [Betaproteobacteria bacterium]|nr:A24 family peptidase [Betaproteobacteria bacterium]
MTFAEGRLTALGALALLGALLLTATWHDVRSRRIPNAIVFSGAVLGLLLHSVLPAGGGLVSAVPGGLGLLKSLAGLGIGLAALLPLYFLRAAGAGDAKLMAMVGAFLGPMDALGAVLCTFAAGAVLAVGVAIKAKVFGRMVRNVRLILYGAAAKLAAVDGPAFDARTDAAAKLPYALAIALGTGVWLALRHFS